MGSDHYILLTALVIDNPEALQRSSDLLTSTGVEKMFARLAEAVNLSYPFLCAIIAVIERCRQNPAHPVHGILLNSGIASYLSTSWAPLVGSLMPILLQSKKGADNFIAPVILTMLVASCRRGHLEVMLANLEGHNVDILRSVLEAWRTNEQFNVDTLDLQGICSISREESITTISMVLEKCREMNSLPNAAEGCA